MEWTDDLDACIDRIKSDNQMEIPALPFLIPSLSRTDKPKEARKLSVLATSEMWWTYGLSQCFSVESYYVLLRVCVKGEGSGRVSEDWTAAGGAGVRPDQSAQSIRRGILSRSTEFR